LSHRGGSTIIVQSNQRMPKQKSARFNPKKELSVIAWIENDQGSVLLVRRVAGQKLWTLLGGKVQRNESLGPALNRAGSTDSRAAKGSPEAQYRKYHTETVRKASLKMKGSAVAYRRAKKAANARWSRNSPKKKKTESYESPNP
jgi:ADP-ribose pyrophosphatase YjhB (NUDIX family)